MFPNVAALLLVKASTSSPLWLLPVIWTVPDARVALSTSVTVTPVSTATAAPSYVTDLDAPVVATTGGSFTHVTVTVTVVEELPGVRVYVNVSSVVPGGLLQ